MEYFFNFEKLAYLKEKKPEGCILCHVAACDPCVIDLSVWRDELFVVSVNLYPYNPGHLLIFPQRHLEDIRDFRKEEEECLNDLVKKFLSLLDKTHSPFGYNIGYNMGLTAGASIPHLHLHIIPRYPRETGIADLFAGKRVLVEHPSETAERLRKALAGNR